MRLRLVWGVKFEICPSLSGFTAHAVHGHGARFKLHKTPREWRESGRGIIGQNGANSGKASSTLETLKPATGAGFSVFSRVFLDPLEVVLSHQTRVRIPVALPAACDVAIAPSLVLAMAAILSD